MKKIEVGKFYKTRCGMKARIYAIDGGAVKNNIHGATFDSEYASWDQCSWGPNGRHLLSGKHELDLVSEWEDPKLRLKAYINYMDGSVFFLEGRANSLPEDCSRAPWLDEPLTIEERQ